MTEQTAEEHLRAASDAILLLVAQVEQLERHKRGVPPEHPRFAELAIAVREAADALATFTREEEAWARGASRTGVPMATIESSSAGRPLSRILDRWRAVERQLDVADPGSVYSKTLFGEFERLRDEYLAAFRDRDQPDDE